MYYYFKGNQSSNNIHILLLNIHSWIYIRTGKLVCQETIAETKYSFLYFIFNRIVIFKKHKFNKCDYHKNIIKINGIISA